MERFSKELLEVLPSLYTGLIYDAMHQDIKYKAPFVLDRNIYSICGNQKMYGPAFTCQGAEVEHLSDVKDEIRIEMLKAMTPGCIKVVAGGNETVAISGDITTLLDKKYGAAGAIMDGLIRDIDVIENEVAGFPVFARGNSPVDAFGKWQIEEYQVDVFMSGLFGHVKVSPGDFIFADKSGIVVIPSEIKIEVLNLATERLHSENKVRHRIQSGEEINIVFQEETRW